MTARLATLRRVTAVAGIASLVLLTITSEIWLLPYFLFRTWVVAFGVRLLRRPLSSGR